MARKDEKGQRFEFLVGRIDDAIKTMPEKGDGLLIVKKNNDLIEKLENFEEMEKLFIEKLGLNERYFNQKNHFFLNKKS